MIPISDWLKSQSHSFHQSTSAQREPIAHQSASVMGKKQDRSTSKHRGQLKKQGGGPKKHSAAAGPSVSSSGPVFGKPQSSNAVKKLNVQRLSQKRDELRLMKVSKHRGTASSLEDLMGRVAQTAQSFEKQQQQQESSAAENAAPGLEINDTSRRAYMKELRKVVDRADVILQVLDARDPMGCRSSEMEEAIGNRHGKKIVLVLNKIDLVPPHVLQPWLNYLRTFYPTVAFKASTQQQSSHISANFGRADKAAQEAVTGSKAVGTDALMQLLKNYCRNAHIKTAITVGIIGYPNVGKSSVINSLKRSKAASVSSNAGHTKVMQEVHIDSKIKLLDCPGIVFDSSDSKALLLRNCINTETMADPIGAVQVLLTRCEPAQLVQLYQLPAHAQFNDTIEFLVLVATAKGKLGKGGIPDRQAAARIILQDWNRGKIPFFTPPPDQKHEILESQIVSSFGNEFDLDKVLNPTSIFMSEVAEEPEAAGPVCSIEVTGQQQPQVAQLSAMDQVRKAMNDSDSSDDDDDDDEDMDMDVSYDRTSALAGFQLQTPSLQQLTAQFEQDRLNPQTAALAKRRAKQWRKLKRRAARQQIGTAAESEIADQMEGLLGAMAQPMGVDPDL